jgi:hypothetical protein
MTRYKRRIIYTSVAIHTIAIGGIFTYWLLTPDLEIPVPTPEKKQNPQTASAKATPKKQEIPDTGKNPYDDFEQGDLSNPQLQDVLKTSIKISDNLTTEEKAKQLTEKFNALSKTPVKEVEKMSELITKSFGAKPESKAPMREVNAQKGISLDADSTRLYDFEIVENKYALIYKDKNNVFFKMPAVPLSEIDPSLKLRLNLIKKAKENKKVRLILNATDALLNILSPPEKSK